jgi:hypothetical protein
MSLITTGLTTFIKQINLNFMDLKDFGKYIQGKPIGKLVHRARKKSLQAILASEKELATSLRRTTPPKRAAGVK